MTTSNSSHRPFSSIKLTELPSNSTLSNMAHVTFHVDDNETDILPPLSRKDIGTDEKEKEKEEKEALVQMSDPKLEWVTMSLERLQQRLQSHFDMVDPKASVGLSPMEAQERLMRDGPNSLTPPLQQPEWLKYLTMYLDPFMILLTVAGILCFIAYALDTSQPLNMWVGVVLEIAVFLSASFSYVTERRAGDSMAAFKKLLPRSAWVIRGGKRLSIPASDLVIGDIVFVGTGDQVPADMRLLASTDMKIEKASLTGESLPVSVDPNPVPVSKFEDATNIIFNTTQCMEGEGYGVVIAIGDNTLIGTIASLVTTIKTQLTPVQIEINHFVKRLATFAFVLGFTFFIIGIARGKYWITAFISSFIVCMVACIPEGLPLTALACLSVTANRMAKKKVFIKQLSSVETLGSVTAIASDKTGTLTQNRMSVVGIWIDQFHLSASSVNTSFPIALPSLVHNVKATGSNGGLAMSKDSVQTFNLLELAAVLCNRSKFADETQLSQSEALSMERAQLLQGMDASLTMGGIRNNYPTLLGDLDAGISLRTAIAQYSQSKSKSGEREVIGDATDKALFNFIAGRQEIELIRYHNRVVFDLPFNSRNKYAITICAPFDVKASPSKVQEGAMKQEKSMYTSRRLFMKGAPEVVLAKCTNYLCRGETRPIDEDFIRSYTEAYETFGSRGERVLGFAWIEMSTSESEGEYSTEKANFPQDGLTFLGLISLVDPPKPTVPAAVQLCRLAGVKVMMVTGDHALTAAAIARQCSILTQPTVQQLATANGCSIGEIPDTQVRAIVVEGSQLLDFNEADWNRVLSKDEIVFARTTPAQKLQIVTQLQRLKHIVAVTGDGVNDSPALKQADIGVAMGIMGSDVARQAANVILMDDDFASIVEGVRAGRTIFDNLAKTIAYTCSHLIPETIPTLLTLAFDMPAAIPSLAILAIDLGTELAPAISFAYEVSESDVMSRPPRKRTDRLIGANQAGYIFLSGLLNSAWTWLGYCLVFQYYHIPLSSLPFSSDYWVSGADPFVYQGPAGCSMDSTVPEYTTDCRSYTDSEQLDILSKAQGVVFYQLVMFQLFHILMCKTRFMSIFKHPMFENIVMLYGMCIETALMIIFLFVPVLNALLVGIPMPGKFFALPLLSWGSLFILSEGRKWLVRMYPNGFAFKYLSW